MTTKPRYVRVSITRGYPQGCVPSGIPVTLWKCAACGHDGGVATVHTRAATRADRHARNCPAVAAATERDAVKRAFSALLDITAEAKAERDQLRAENTRLRADRDRLRDRLMDAITALTEALDSWSAAA